jgi:hypothetical protein
MTRETHAAANLWLGPWLALMAGALAARTFYWTLERFQ